MTKKMVIGLTGSLAAGKGVVSDFLKQNGFVYLSLSDELREIVKECKMEITRKNLQDMGNKMREEKGAGYLAEKVVEKIKNQSIEKAIVDGIRNPAEVEVLKKLNNFFLISIDAPQEIRFKRMVERNRESDPKNWEEFLQVDNKDKGIGEIATGQASARCMELSNYILFNLGALEELQEKIKKLYEEIERKIPRPTWDEYFLEISKTVAKRATCNRGRSGCVIAKDKQILVTGYVGSPRGLPHCDEIGHQMKSMIQEDGSITHHCVRTTHAEQNAICQAAKFGISIDGATLYCKMVPCYNCAMRIVRVGVKKVVAQKRYHADGLSVKLFNDANVELIIIENTTEEYKNQ